MKIEYHLFVDSTKESVFASCEDIRVVARHYEYIEAARYNSDFNEGADFEIDYKGLGFQFRRFGKITKLEHGSIIEWVSEDPYQKIKTTARYSETDLGTNVFGTVEVQEKGIRRFLQPLTAHLVVRQYSSFFHAILRPLGLKQDPSVDVKAKVFGVPARVARVACWFLIFTIALLFFQWQSRGPLWILFSGAY